jgi:pimeloyl-ACP methyl ester carboxylesterase
MSNQESIRKLWVVVPLFIVFAFLLVVPSSPILISNNRYFGTTNLAYGQPTQMNSNVTNSLNILNIPVKKVHVGDIDIAYKTFGKGDPILLISGLGNNMTNAWEPSTLRSLSLNHTVIVFDNRGVENTTTGSKPFSIRQLANDTVGLLHALKIQKADILGYSLGSFIAQQLTVTHPEKVNRLVLVAASCGGKESIPPSPQLVKLSRELTNKSSNTINQLTNIAINWTATNWNGICDDLTKISIPTLVITGTDDVSVASANSLIIAGKIPGAWLVQIKGAGHLLPAQFPDKFDKVLQTFLSTTTNPG